MTDLLIVLGSVTPPGRMHRALQRAQERLAGSHPSRRVRLLDLAEHRLGFADGRPPEQMGDDTATAVSAITEAKSVIFASPVYRASFTGALKNLLDHVPVEALQGKPCGIVAMGATQHHYLGVDRHLRDVLSWFGALVAPTSVYLTSADFQSGEPSEEAVDELAALCGTLLRLYDLVGETMGELGPGPLAGRGRTAAQRG
jgi:FMN reductase